MNKLLSTLILSAGMSLSATAATSLLDSSIVGYSDFASQTADFGTLKDSVSITSDDSNLTLSGITFNGYGANNRDVMSVTMVLDLSKINTPDAYTALFNAKNSSVSWGVGLNTDRKLQGSWNNTSNNGHTDNGQTPWWHRRRMPTAKRRKQDHNKAKRKRKAHREGMRGRWRASSCPHKVDYQEV